MKVFWKQCRFKIPNKTQWAMTMAYKEVTGKGVQVCFQDCPCATVEMVWVMNPLPNSHTC